MLPPDEIAWLGKTLRGIKMFSTLTTKEADDLIRAMEKQEFGKGKKIIKQGAAGDSFYIIYKGSAAAQVKKGWFGSVALGELGPGQFFGEMALLSDEPRSASVVAREATSCFVLRRTEFRGLLEKNPAFAQWMEKIKQDRRLDGLLKQT